MDNSTLFLLLVIIFGLIVSTLVAVRNGFSGLKLMLLGITIILSLTCYIECIIN